MADQLPPRRSLRPRAPWRRPVLPESATRVSRRRATPAAPPRWQLRRPPVARPMPEVAPSGPPSSSTPWIWLVLAAVVVVVLVAVAAFFVVRLILT